MDLDFSLHAKEDELLFIFRSLTPEQQMTMIGMVRGVFSNLPTEQPLDADSPRTMH